MMTILTVLAVWGIGSIVFVLALAAAAAKSSPETSRVGGAHYQTAEEILERLNLVERPQRRMPAHARTARAH